MPNLSTTATLSGTLYFSNGKPASGKSVVIKRVTDTSGNLISSDHTLYKSNASGQFNMVVPMNSYVYIYSDAESLNTLKNGSPIYIGTESTYELRSVSGNLNYPEQIPIAISGGSGGVSSFINLSDVESPYVQNQLVAVNSTGDGLVYVNHSSYATTASLSGYATTVSLSSYATESSLSGYVDTTNTQSITGTKTFTEGICVVSDQSISDITGITIATLNSSTDPVNHNVTLYSTSMYNFDGSGVVKLQKSSDALLLDNNCVYMIDMSIVGVEYAGGDSALYTILKDSRSYFVDSSGNVNLISNINLQKKSNSPIWGATWTASSASIEISFTQDTNWNYTIFITILKVKQ